MDLEGFGFRDVSLMEGETVESALSLSSEGSVDRSQEPDVMLLTDRRVIHLHGKGKRRGALFASIEDIHSVEIDIERQGSSGFVWAGLAFLVALLLFFVVENTVGRAAAAAIVGLMGVYLVVDQLTSAGRPLMVFRAGLSQFRCDLRSDRAHADAYPFINRLFQLKEENGRGRHPRARRFAPR